MNMCDEKLAHIYESAMICNVIIYDFCSTFDYVAGPIYRISPAKNLVRSWQDCAWFWIILDHEKITQLENLE